jgi:hypothetical protein
VGKRRRILLPIFVIAVVGGIAWFASEPSDPVYQGRRLSEWVDDNYQSHLAVARPGLSKGAQERAENAIRHIGTNAIPTLLKMIRYTDSPLKKKIMALADKQRLITVNIHPEDYYHDSAYTAFMALGPVAKPAVPNLVALLTDKHSSVQTNAADLLVLIDPEAAARLGLKLSPGTSKPATREHFRIGQPEFVYSYRFS